MKNIVSVVFIVFLLVSCSNQTSTEANSNPDNPSKDREIEKCDDVIGLEGDVWGILLEENGDPYYEYIDEYTENKNKAYYKNEPYNGIIKNCYANGLIKEYSTWKDGRKNGKSIRYYENGDLCDLVYFKNGLRDGEYVFYNKEDSGYSKTFFRNGLEDGEAIISLDGTKKNAIIEIWNKGDLISRKSYKDGEFQSDLPLNTH
jgi:antitoxin component YwqK of YwqJK toxin-antitoxin module